MIDKYRKRLSLSNSFLCVHCRRDVSRTVSFRLCRMRISANPGARVIELKWMSSTRAKKIQFAFFFSDDHYSAHSFSTQHLQDRLFHSATPAIDIFFAIVPADGSCATTRTGCVPAVMQQREREES